MKLKKLEITGFKSFCDRSAIEFPHGVSAIVGPNGCGKSNIVDALRWVMGEQSVKQLRGKSMEDVIFAGASGKPPVNMAEVTLTLLNDNGSAPEELRDYTEIMLTRRLYRSGESAYFLNKQPCRLKDIHNVFLGSGVGTRSYAIIQQGNIGAIIDAGPEERRHFIEEAAGTTRFKIRKIEALRKVDSTQQNLLRVSDIIAEINRQMGGLKRQARKAERFRLYQKRIMELDVRLSLYRYAGLSLKIDETDRLLRGLKDADIAHAAQMKKLDAAVEAIKLQRWQKDQEIAALKARKYDLLRNADRFEGDLAHLRQEVERLRRETDALQQAREELEEKNRGIGREIEQSQAENSRHEQEIARARAELQREQSIGDDMRQRLDAFNKELEHAKAELMEWMTQETRYRNIHQNTSQNKENLQRRLKRIAEEAASAQQRTAQAREAEAQAKDRLEALKRDISELTAELEHARRDSDAKREALGHRVKQVHALELERNNVRTKFTTLKKMEENFEWYRDGVRAVMRAPEFVQGASRSDPDAGAPNVTPAVQEIKGLLADILTPEADYRTAVEAVLGEALQYILVETPETGVRAIEYLQTRNAGRGGFIPVSAVLRKGEERRQTPGEAADLLLRHVAVRPGYERIAEAFLGRVAVAGNLQDALAAFDGNGHQPTVVTRDGQVVSRQGVMIGGSDDKLPGILAKKQELKTLERQLQKFEVQLEEARKHQEALEADAREAESTLQQCYERKQSAEADAIEAEKELYRSSEELKHALRHSEITELEHEQLLGEESDLDDQLAEYNGALAKLTGEIDTAKAKVAESNRRVDDAKLQLENFNRQTVDIKLNLTALNARLEHSSATLRRLREFLTDGANRLEQLAEDIVRKCRKAEASQSRISELQSELTASYEEIKQVEERIERDESNYNAIDAQLKDNDTVISELLHKREEIQEKTRLLELEQTQRSMQRENIARRLEENYRRPFEEHRTELTEMMEAIESATEELSVEAVEDELARLRERVAAIGDVNLAAINEYEQLKSRHDFLCEQREDLRQAVDDLHKVIKKINRITQERFLETFDQVNQKLTEVFPRLFEGGSAKLVLTDPDSPLETGVEYMIHPPGKKLTRMSLLSGGEKALSAIAFIFSLFLMRPTAFCLMDEIDAPLDEANVYRFNNLLKLIGEKSQIVMVTHNKKSMEFADMLFGITMETKGVSKVVSVRLDGSDNHP